MPLRGYLKTSDRGRISSISAIDHDPTRRKKILPISKHSENMYVQIYVLDCSTHETGGPVVPVVLMQLKQGLGWEELGTAKCCPLCWAVLQPPPGISLPVAKLPQEPKKTSEKQRAALKKGRSGRRGGATPETLRILDDLINLFTGDPGDWYVEDIMDHMKVPRSTARHYLLMLEKQGEIQILTPTRGRGMKTVYRKAP
jgi:hypothetical protein